MASTSSSSYTGSPRSRAADRRAGRRLVGAVDGAHVPERHSAEAGVRQRVRNALQPRPEDAVHHRAVDEVHLLRRAIERALLIAVRVVHVAQQAVVEVGVLGKVLRELLVGRVPARAPHLVVVEARALAVAAESRVEHEEILALHLAVVGRGLVRPVPVVSDKISKHTLARRGRCRLSRRVYCSLEGDSECMGTARNQKTAL